MGKRIKILYRISSWLLMLLMIASIFLVIPLTANAAEITKEEKNYDIAVVFDNSGSMYGNKRWCRAKYAMEIFASMLNYPKDKLHIFPMWKVTTDGSKPESGGDFSAFEIKNVKDIDKISNMYTPIPSDTPFAPVLEAHEYLKSSKANEKWLIVLTDGEFNRMERDVKIPELKGNSLRQRLIQLATNGIKIQYLGFAGAESLTPDEANSFFAKNSDDTSLKNDLIEICNYIFQRSILPSNRLGGTSLNLDLSMKNLIVFAQGKNANIDSLKDSNGKEIKVTLNSGRRKFSDISAGGQYKNSPVDEDLAGQVVTFAACPKGNYTLSYSGADSIQIFYEPDVDIDVSLENSDGERVNGPDDFFAGEYTVTSRITDSSTGEDVTTHELMGNNVKLKTYVKTSKDSGYKEFDNGSKIEFKPDDKTEIYIEGEYLGKYKITSKDDPKLAWLNELKVKQKTFDFVINATVLQPHSWFKIRDHENWKPIKISMTLDGQPLTDEQMANVKLSVTASGGLKCRYEPIQGESAYNVYIAQDESGKFIKPKTGNYKLHASATYTGEYDNDESAEANASFDIQWYSKFWRWLLWILIILAIIIIILLVLNHPTLPSSLYLYAKKTSNVIKTNGTVINLSSDLYPGEIRCEAKACTPLKDRGKTTASFEVKDIKPLGSVLWYEIDNSKFKKVNGKYVNEDNETIDQVKPKIRVSDETELKWKTTSRTVTGKIYINHNN